MRIVHFSTTRLAGAPIRLVRALQVHTEHDARLVDLHRWGQFEHDLVFSESADEVVELCERADVIHLHNYLDYDSTAFRPVDFVALRDHGKRFVRHFHSTPETIAARMGNRPDDAARAEIPSLVISGYPERYYPLARVVRNVVPLDEPPYRPADERDGIAFTPSVPTGAWAERWNTKGMPETVAMLRRVARTTGCRLRVVHGRPLEEALAEKRASLAVVDDLVTGSYHLSGFEGLALAKPVLCHLDARIRHVLAALTGAAETPFVDARLEDAEDVLVAMVREPAEAAALGAASRAWVEEHWREGAVAAEFAAVYEELLEDPGLVTRQHELRVDGAARVTAVVVPDLIWAARRRRALATRPLRAKTLDVAGRTYRRLPLRVRLRVRRGLGRPT